jgi:integrase
VVRNSTWAPRRSRRASSGEAVNLVSRDGGAHDECVEAAPDIAPPARHARDVRLHGGVAVGLRDLRVAARDEGRLRSDPHHFPAWVEAAEPPGKVTLHTLRHSYASRLVLAGVDLVTIRELGGWSEKGA